MVHNKLRQVFTNVIIQCILMLNFCAINHSLPYYTNEHQTQLKMREPRAVYEVLGHSVIKRQNCSNKYTNLDDCQEDIHLSDKVLTCLNSCANCVKQWRIGVYNGRNCANDCVQQMEHPKDSMDPDCNLLKYFNSTILANSQK